jgi:hypothetical protein
VGRKDLAHDAYGPHPATNAHLVDEAHARPEKHGEIDGLNDVLGEALDEGTRGAGD